MKKKALSLFLVLAMLLSMIPLSPMTAFSAVEGDWLYTLYDDDTTAAITGYTGSDPSIIIPSTIAGKPVTRIGGNAFEDKVSLTSVIIPDSVLRIENRAFTNSGLTSVDLGEGVEYIGQYAFNGTELASLSIPNSVEIIDIAAFALCDKLSSISIIGNNLSTLGDGAFSGTAITSFRIPTSLSIIEDNTFKDCVSLSSIQIPSNISSIDYYAFGGCSSLVSSTFEGNAPTMGNFVFSNSHADFKIYYYTGSTGFDTPTWTTGLVTYNTVVLDPLPDYVCEIGSMQYESFTSALAAAVDGDTITMLKNIEHNNHINMVNKNLTLDLNGFTFTLNNPVGDGLWVDHGSWNLTGEGEFNVTARYYPVYAYNGGSITVTNVSNNEDGGWPAAFASGTGSNITVLEDSVANGTGGKAAYSSDDATVTILGNAIAVGNEGQATFAQSGNIIVHGDTLTSGSNCFSNYSITGGNILIKGNANSTGYGSYTVYSDGENSSIEVLGNLAGTALGVYSRNSASTLIHGNVTATAGHAILVESSGNVDVLGDVVATGGAGVYVSIGTATIEGTITANNYIVLFGEIKTTNDYIEPTTKLGYLTYSYEDATYGTSTVWVAADLPVATNVDINGSAIVGETLTGEYDFNGTTESGSTFRWLADTGAESEVFNTMNISGVNNNPTVPAEFVLSETTVISKIYNYHWNNSYGAVPGTIALQEAGGTMYGPWDAEGKYGNLYWEVTPFVELPAGTYTIIDSSNETWANNYESGYRGMTVVSAANYSDNFIPIESAVDQTYLLTSEDVGKKIKFEVTVKDLDGLTGTPVTSSAIGPVSLPITIEVLFSGGTGTALDPYLISSEADLIDLAQKVSGGKSFSGKYFKQTQDIDLTQAWVPIGWKGSYYDTNIPFNGHYDGQSKIISNLNIASGISWAGLFSVVGNDGVLDSVELQNASISGGNLVGALAGELRGVIRNCNVDGSVTGNFATGGVVGQTYDGLIENCHSSATVTGTGEFTGGLAGYAFSSYGSTEITITQSSSSGNVTGSNKTGGLIGGIQGGRCLKSFATGIVTGTNNYTGGLVGVIDSANGFIASIEDCYAQASVIAPNTSYVGGLAGANWYGTIRNSYAAGTINSDGVIDAGGLTGSIYSGAVAIDSYYDTELCGLSDTGKGIPKTTAEMKAQVTFSNWSFPDEWTLSSDNNGYPALAWQGYTHETLPDDSNWINGITSAGQYPFGGGDGSSEALAYEISTTNQLAQLAYNVNNGNDYTGKYFKLMNDLDLSGKEWTPIGYRFIPGQEKGFNGNFDGNNKRITNIAIGSSSEPKTGGDQTQAGLFGATRYVANIKDLHVQGSLYVYNVSTVGMLLGYSESGETISGCSAEGTIISTGSGDIRIGGLVGDTSGTSVIRCSSDVDINASNGSMAVGGLIGYHGAFSYDRIRPLDSCIYTGTLTSGNVPSYGGVGGIAGKSYGYTIIYNSVNKGTITGSEGNIGGIVGIQHNEGIINCYSSGTVAGNGNYPSAVGGITGYIDWGNVYNCYDSGRVSSTGTALVGALVGYAPSTSTIVSNGYFDGTINNDLAHVRSTSGNKYYLHEFTTEVMKGADPGFDFEYADGVYANGENAIIEALNGWIDLKQSTYPDTIFKEWNIISILNDGYPNLTDAEEPVPSNDATLSALAASGVTLSPAFSSSVTSYSANVYYSKTSVSIAATSSNSNAVVNINGDNTLTKDVNLAVGSNTITILVTAEDTITTETYTITLNRAAASSGGGSSKPTAPPPVNVTTVTTNDIITNKTITDTEETNGTAEADITTPMVNALLQKANETSGTDKGDLFEVDMNIDKDIDKLDVTISQSNLARIASQTDVGLALTSSFASITFDGRALETIAGANSGGDVLISANLVDKNTLSEKDKETVKDRPVYDFSVFNSGTQVSDFSGGKATVSVPYTLQPGEDPESVVIYHLADNGSLKTVRGHYDAASGSVIFTTSHFSKFIVGYNQVSFTDVLPGSWYKNAVDFIAAREITSGTASGIFSPDAKLTRGQFVVLLMNAYQINIQNQESTNQIQNFSDAGNTYYTNHLKAAKALGIVNGVGNNLFAPEKEITRQEMFVMLHNALKAIDEVPEVVISKDLSSFSDANQIDDWANEAFTNLVNAGIVTGSNNKLTPTNNTTRAEIAQVLYNLFTK